MNNMVLLFVLLLLVSSYVQSANHTFVVDKDFSETSKIIEEYLTQSHFQVVRSNDRIFEIYFDTPELFFLKHNGFIRYKAIEYLSKKNKKTKYNEKIEHSLEGTRFGDFSVKHYNNIQTFEEKHPLLSLVKRKERQVFLDKLSSDGIKHPMRLKKIIQISKLVHTFELSSNALKRGSISVNKVETSALDSTTEFLMLEINIENNQALINDLYNLLEIRDKKAFSNEYAVAFSKMKQNVSLFYWILRYPYMVNLLYAIGYGLFGMAIIFALFWERLRNSE